jgi:hypothetical protein
MAIHGPLNAFSFDISLVKIGQEINLLEHLKKNWITLYIVCYIFFLKQKRCRAANTNLNHPVC